MLKFAYNVTLTNLHEWWLELLLGCATLHVSHLNPKKRPTMALAKNPLIYNAISEAIERYGEKHHITARQHLAPLLGYGGVNGSIQLGTALNCTTYNPATPKPISVDQLMVLIKELGRESRGIVDLLCREAGGVFSFSAECSRGCESIKDELLTISALQGELASKFLEFKLNDGVIDAYEAKRLKAIAYETRSKLLEFEQQVDEVSLDDETAL